MEHEVARLATAQHGVVTRAELLAAGLSRAGIQRRVNKRSLILEHRGVYRVGHTAPSVEATYLAAVKACGEGALLSGRAAAHLVGLLKSRRPPPPEVTAPTERRAAGIRTRRRKLATKEAMTVRAIPVTTVPRTLVDLAAELPDAELARACHEAGVRYKTTPRQVAAVLRDQPNAPGARKLKRIMEGDTPVSLSKLESLFFAALKAEGLPLPQTNKRAGTKRVDCRWPKHNLTVELVSYAFHNSRHSWEQDHQRRREARARGDEFLTYTWHDITVERAATVAQIRGALRRRV